MLYLPREWSRATENKRVYNIGAEWVNWFNVHLYPSHKGMDLVIRARYERRKIKAEKPLNQMSLFNSATR